MFTYIVSYQDITIEDIEKMKCCDFICDGDKKEVIMIGRVGENE